jgi:ssDNA-binding Zn-finger/Zn-ribbon topoisomerase 1
MADRPILKSDIVEDIPFVPVTEEEGHKFVFYTKIPDCTWRSIISNHPQFTKEKAMEDYKSRMRDEHSQLIERIGKLKAFLWTKAFMDLPETARQRLIEQCAHMRAYERVLAERISLD